MISFNGSQIFGTAELRQMGPTATKRLQRSILPGVIGYRNYNLIGGRAPDTRVWTVSGRIIALSLSQAETMIERGQSYLNGKLYNFRSTGGRIYRNCELVDFRPSENYRAAMIGSTKVITIKVQGTIEQASP